MASAGSAPDPPRPGVAARLAVPALLLLALAALAAVALFWAHAPGGGPGVRHWLAIRTGTCPQSGSCRSGSGGWYGWWSGFGSVFPWSPLSVAGIFGGIWLWYRRNNCRRAWCLRLARYDLPDPAAGVSHRVCWHHHPHVHRRVLSGPALADLQRRLRLYAGQRPGDG